MKFQGLPKTSYYKLIDWWFLISFNILVLTLAFHTYLSYIVSKATKEQFFKLTGVTKVHASPDNKIAYDDQHIRENLMKNAIILNTLGKVTFIILLVLFNTVFWYIAFMEHFRPAEDYL